MFWRSRNHGLSTGKKSFTRRLLLYHYFLEINHIRLIRLWHNLISSTVSYKLLAHTFYFKMNHPRFRVRKNPFPSAILILLGQKIIKLFRDESHPTWSGAIWFPVRNPIGQRIKFKLMDRDRTSKVG